MRNERDVKVAETNITQSKLAVVVLQDQMSPGSAVGLPHTRINSAFFLKEYSRA